jgi:hypothetical protein
MKTALWPFVEQIPSTSMIAALLNCIDINYNFKPRTNLGQVITTLIICIFTCYGMEFPDLSTKSEETTQPNLGCEIEQDESHRENSVDTISPNDSSDFEQNKHMNCLATPWDSVADAADLRRGAA